MNRTCFIRYPIGPFRRAAFRRKRFILREERTFVEGVEGPLP